MMLGKFLWVFLCCILVVTLITWSCDLTSPVDGEQEQEEEEEEEEPIGEQEEEEEEPTSEEELSVHFIDVGQGDSILLDCGDTEVLIDGGDKTPGVVAYLSNYIDGALEVLVATHPHADHIGGLIAILDTFEVGEIWHNGASSTSQTYAQFMNRVNSEDAEVYTARLHDTIQAGALSLYVHHPAELSGSTNNDSIVLHLAYGSVDFLFTGDAEQEAEGQMMILSSVRLPEVEILKLGHHGSSTSSSSDFLTITSPEVAIYMAEEGNSYGHPHQETLNKLNGIGADVYGTDNCGTIVVTTDGESYSISLPPPDFTVSNLIISPNEVEQEELVTISVTVTNIGCYADFHTVTLKLNNSVVLAQNVNLNAGQSQVVDFKVSKQYTGNYLVDVNGLQGSFSVVSDG